MCYKYNLWLGFLILFMYLLVNEVLNFNVAESISLVWFVYFLFLFLVCVISFLDIIEIVPYYFLKVFLNFHFHIEVSNISKNKKLTFVWGPTFIFFHLITSNIIPACLLNI